MFWFYWKCSSRLCSCQNLSSRLFFTSSSLKLVIPLMRLIIMLVMDKINYYGCDVGLKILVNRYCTWWSGYCWVAQILSILVKSRKMLSWSRDINENLWQVCWEKKWININYPYFCEKDLRLSAIPRMYHYMDFKER